MAEQSSLTVASDARLARHTRPGSIVAIEAADAFRAETIALHEKATSAQAFVAIGTSCVRQIALNAPGVRAGSGEAVHQMRIGLRRFRAALSLFKSMLRPLEFDDVKRELVWLTEQLNDARELDVLCESARAFEQFERATLGGESDLGEALKRRRQQAFAIAGRVVGSARFEQLIVSSAVTLISRVDEDGAGKRPMRKLAREILEHRTRRVLRRLRRFSELGVVERHQLRIYAKKLRYGAEFFATLFRGAGGGCKRFIHALEALQDTLGRLNDITVHQRIARALVAEDRNDGHAGRRIAFTIGALTDSERAEFAALSLSVEKLRGRLSDAPRFWR